MAVPSTGGLVAGEHVAALLWLARQLLDWTTIYYLGGFAYAGYDTTHLRMCGFDWGGANNFRKYACLQVHQLTPK